jgi:hypothetical protein
MKLVKDFLKPEKQCIANSKDSEQVNRFFITAYKSLLHKLLFL